MDYVVRSTSRAEVRLYAKLFRGLFGLPLTGPVDPLSLLDQVSIVLGNADYEIVDPTELPHGVPARCVTNDDGTFLIQISEVVFNGAYEKQQGGYRAHILHEIIHAYVDKIGFKPIHNRAFQNKAIPPYMSLEWVVKAMTGEVMMPYEETVNMTAKDLVEKYAVSWEAANQRLRY